MALRVFFFFLHWRDRLNEKIKGHVKRFSRKLIQMKTFYNFSSLFTYSQLYILPLYTKTTKSKFYYLHFIYSLFRRGVRIIGKINTLEKGTSFQYFKFEKTFLKFFIVLQVLRGVTVVQETTLTGEMTNRMIFTTTKIASHIKTYGG